ncbi:class I SAM-dependent methyltransferase [Actinosynnema sp. NPDC023794]
MTQVDPGRRFCRICGGTVEQCLDFGTQPVSNAFLLPEHIGRETYFHLAVGLCQSCGMVQQLEEVPREAMFGFDYPYRSCMSALMRKHFQQTAQQLLETELAKPDPFIVEIGSNDGIMLDTVRRAGVRHLGVDPSGGPAEVARDKGIRVRVDYFEESSARAIRAEDGPADVIFSANTISHIAYMDSILRGVDALLADDGVFVVEDRYLGDVVEHNYFDQIYDEHFYLFAIKSVGAMVARFGFELVDAERIPVHGGAMRYTIARAGRRAVSQAVLDLADGEAEIGLDRLAVYARFRDEIKSIRSELTALLTDLRAQGKTVVGYGATSKSATVTNYCGIGPDLVPYISDTTPVKQGRVTPGSHIPIVAPERFSRSYPDYALLFAWNHADEIMAKERAFRESGGKWILYVPRVHVV